MSFHHSLLCVVSVHVVQRLQSTVGPLFLLTYIFPVSVNEYTTPFTLKDFGVPSFGLEYRSRPTKKILQSVERCW